MVQNLRACFILYGRAIKKTMCLKEKIDLSPGVAKG